MRQTTRLFVAILALALAVPAPLPAREPFAGMDLLWVRPADDAGAQASCTRLLVLNLPRDWMFGDAAVAIFADDDAEPLVRPLVAALLHELAAVLEVPSRQAEGCPAPPAAPAADVLGAVRALRVDASAGLVVAIGIGATAPAVLAATRGDVAARYLGPDGPRLAAAIALGGQGPAVFARGAVPEGQAWETRCAPLCAALASATGRIPLGACLSGLGVDRPMAGTTQPARP